LNSKNGELRQALAKAAVNLGVRLHALHICFRGYSMR